MLMLLIQSAVVTSNICMPKYGLIVRPDLTSQAMVLPRKVTGNVFVLKSDGAVTRIVKCAIYNDEFTSAMLDAQVYGCIC